MRPLILFVVAGLAVAGCSGAGDSPGANDTSATAGSSPGGTSAATATPDPGTSQSPSVEPDGVAGTPLSDAEKDFVAASGASDDAFSGAVVEAGWEACQRIERTAAQDEDALVAALVMGQIAEAENAVTHLCPQFETYVERARGGFPDGTFAVGDVARHGETVAAGRYVAPTGGEDCRVVVTDADGGVLVEGDRSSEIRITSDAASVDSSGCYAWVKVE